MDRQQEEEEEEGETKERERERKVGEIRWRRVEKSRYTKASRSCIEEGGEEEEEEDKMSRFYTIVLRLRNISCTYLVSRAPCLEFATDVSRALPAI